MPQLDFSIIFPQIFWLCILFTIFYFILTFYLLPNFLIALKSRHFILDENSRKLNLYNNSFSNLKNPVNQKLKENFDNILINFDNINFIFKNQNNSPLSSINNVLSKATVQTLFFCNSTVFKNINFYPKTFWKNN